MARVLTAGSGPAAVREGLALVRRRGLAAVVIAWALVALLAVLAVVPAWAWWARELSRPIDATRLLGSPNLAILTEVAQANPAGWRMLWTTAIAAAFVALLLNPFLAGGVLGAISRDPGDDGPVARFAAEGALHYGPMLRVLLIAGVLVAVFLSVASPGVATLADAAGASDLAVFLAGLAVAALTVGVAGVLVDLARIRIVRGDTRKARVAIGWATVFAVRHAPALLVVAVACGALIAVTVAALAWTRGALPATTWPSILAGLALQQASALARTWLRASWLAGELALVEAVVEDAPAAPAIELPPELPIAAAAPAREDAGVRGTPASLALEERPEVLVVVERETGEGGLARDERLRGGDLAPEIPGRLPAEGDPGRRDAGPGEAGPAAAAHPADRDGA
jgi:hypothetical protein